MQIFLKVANKFHPKEKCVAPFHCLLIPISAFLILTWKTISKHNTKMYIAN